MPRQWATASPARAPRGRGFVYYVAPGSTRASFSQLQALYVRDSRTPRPNHRMCKTEGPTILSASYGSVKGRGAVRAGRQTKRAVSSGKTALILQKREVYSPAPEAARCFF